MAFTLAQLEHLFCCWTGGDGGDDADMLSIGVLCLSGSCRQKRKDYSADYEKAQTSPIVEALVTVLWAKHCLKSK